MIENEALGVEDDGGATVHVCAGPPRCSLEGDAAVEAMQAGCVWCRRIFIEADGTEHEIGPHEA